MLFELDGHGPVIADETCWVAPGAQLIGKVRIESGAGIWFNAVLRGDNEWLTVGENTNIQDGCIIHTDEGAPATLGRNVTMGHGVIFHSCSAADNVLIGMGSTILSRTTIGSNTIIAAGSLISEDKEIPSGVLALGRPARIIRDLTESEIQMIQWSADYYHQNAQRYLKGLVQVSG